MRRLNIAMPVLVVLLSVMAFMIFERQVKDKDTLYQVSVLCGLMKGDYGGKLALSDIRRHGDFGIGTFERLDGEAIELDGIFYQVRSDGKVVTLPGNTKSPFVMVTYFDTDIESPVTPKSDYRSLQEFIDKNLPTKNIPYAVKVEGKFNYIKTRSVPSQNKPYPLLAEVAKNQSVFEFHDIEGTLVGFRMPDYAQGVNMPGYHMHFLSRDKSKGGHLLECAIDSGKVKIDNIDSLEIALPGSQDFYNLELSTNQADVLAVESNRK